MHIKELKRIYFKSVFVAFSLFFILFIGNNFIIKAQNNTPSTTPKTQLQTSKNTVPEAQDEPPIKYFKAKIIKISPNQPCKITQDNKCVKYTVKHDNATYNILVDFRNSPYLKYLHLKPNDTVIIQHQGDLNYIIGIDRSKQVILLAILFLAVVLAVSGLQGLSALFGLLIAFALMIYLFIPAILQGYNPYIVTGIIEFIALAISVYFSHGINIKSHIVFASSTIALFLAWLLAAWAVKFTRLTGLTSEEYISLNTSLAQPLDIAKILVTVIILGVLGSIDDVAINQAGFILSFAKNNPNLPLKTVYKEATQIGKDHTASMINTLAIVYISSALPIVLILAAHKTSLLEILNRELFVEEIVKSIVVSTILLLAVPITNILTIFIAKKIYKRK